MNELALFAGAGLGLLGTRLLGWRTVCAVEIDPFCRNILIARQRDGCLDKFPIWDDVRTFDGRPWRGSIDIITGGFPCQDISAAGRGAGIDGEKSGLWREFARIIREVRPQYALVENSPMLTVRGLGRVLGDLASMWYDAQWCVLGADNVGAPHARKRIWILAHANDKRHGNITKHAEMARPPEVAERVEETGKPTDSYGQHSWVSAGKAKPRDTNNPWWSMDIVAGVDDGSSNWMDRVRATGNGQVPSVVALAWKTLKGLTQ